MIFGHKKFKQRLAVNLGIQMIAVLAVIAIGFHLLTTAQTKELRVRLYDKAQLFAHILGTNLDKVIDDNLKAFDQLQRAIQDMARAQPSIERLRVVSPEGWSLASSRPDHVKHRIADEFTEIIQDVIRTRQSKSVVLKVQGADHVHHILPVMSEGDEAKVLLGVLQISVVFPSGTDSISAAVRSNKAQYYRKESHDMAVLVRVELQSLVNDVQKNLGYLEQHMNNILGDEEVDLIQLYVRELDTLVYRKDNPYPEFLSEKLSSLQREAIQEGSTVFREDRTDRRLTVVSPLRLSTDMGADSAGVMTIGFRLDKMSAMIDQKRMDMLAMAGAMAVCVILLISVFFRRRIFQPIQELTDLMEQVKQRDLSHRSANSRTDEIGTLAQAFNGMLDDLEQSKKEIKAWNEQLQDKVDQAGQALREKQAQLVKSEKLASLGILSSGIAHEINNPLGIILGDTQIFLRDLEQKERPFDSAEAEELLKNIEQNTKRCSHIVKSLLDFARKKDFQFIPTKLSGEIENALLFTSGRYGRKDLVVHRDYPDDLPPVAADPIQMDQVFINILINAEQSMDSGGIMRIQAARTSDKRVGPDCVQVSFSDSGHGISPEDLPRVFDPFFSTKEAGEGVGLGLSVSYGIIQTHKGEIDVRSTLGQGTTVTVTLPVMKDEVEHV